MKNAAEAIREANKKIDDNPESIFDAKEELYNRAKKLYGSSAFSFTPRVANLWLEGGEGVNYLASLTLAANQDFSYPCEVSWAARKQVAQKTLDAFPWKTIRQAMNLILQDRYQYVTLATDFYSLPKLISRIAPTLVDKERPLPATPLSQVDVTKRHESVPADPNDNWIKLRLKEING